MILDQCFSHIACRSRITDATPSLTANTNLSDSSPMDSSAIVITLCALRSKESEQQQQGSRTGNNTDSKQVENGVDVHELLSWLIDAKPRCSRNPPYQSVDEWTTGSSRDSG